MQLPNAPSAEKFQIVVAALQRERLMRYMPAANHKLEQAFSFYLWNCSICESFHLIFHVAEIVCRNSLNKALMHRAGENWYADTTFIGLLDERFRRELTEAVADEKAQHRTAVTAHHIVSALTFGFWNHLATKRFERFLWSRGMSAVFPNIPKDATLTDLFNLIEGVRRWRNRIAHHRAIFDKKPTRKHAEALTLIQWSCLDTGAWAASVSTVPQAISARPR